MAPVERAAPEEARPPGLGVLLIVALPLYAAAAAIATYPGIADASSTVPALLGDQYQHLAILRWWAECLTTWRSPLLNPAIDYPVGGPLGNFTPMHLQALLYLAISPLASNDFEAYRTLWLLGFAMTGAGTFALAARLSGDRWCAAFAGLAAMLSCPMIVRSWGHLELMYVGAFPMFLASWIPFVDRPGRGRLAAAAGLYLLVAMSAAYFAVFSVAPSVLYLGWAAWRRPGAERRAWLAGRTRWLLAFAAAVLPGLLLLFAPQIWARANGYTMPWSPSESDRFGASISGYLFPEEFHRLHRFLPFDPERIPSLAGGPQEGGSYLGVATLGLLAYAAARRTRFPRASYWWATLGVLVALSLGPYREFGGHRVELPSGWLLAAMPGAGLIRDTYRINLFAAVVAAIIAAEGLRHLASGLPRAWARRGAALGAMAVVLADLGVPITPVPVIEPPACYAELARERPGAALLEIEPPEPMPGPLALGYWQSLHGGRTSATFSGLVNREYLYRIALSSPVSRGRLDAPDFLSDPDSGCYDFISRAAFLDYLWLFAEVHGYDFIVLHKGRDPSAAEPEPRLRLKGQLAGAIRSEDDATIVYDPARLGPPGRPTLLLNRGWRIALNGMPARTAERSATIAVYNPDPDRPLTVSLRAEAFRRRRAVRLMDGPRELARWECRPGERVGLISPAFTLPAGVTELTLESDGDRAPRSPDERPAEWDGEPFSLYVREIAVAPAPPEADPEATPPG